MEFCYRTTHFVQSNDDIEMKQMKMEMIQKPVYFTTP